MQFLKVEGLTSAQYTVAIRLTPDQSLASQSPHHQQSARTCGSSSDPLSSELEVVTWNEIFFFKVDSLVRIFFPEEICTSILLHLKRNFLAWHALYCLRIE